MLLACHFILNCVEERESFTFYPWVDSVSNVIGMRDPCCPVRLPDKCSVDILESSPFARHSPPPPPPPSSGSSVRPLEIPKFSMCAGDFVEVCLLLPKSVYLCLCLFFFPFLFLFLFLCPLLSILLSCSSPNICFLLSSICCVLYCILYIIVIHHRSTEHLT